MASQPIFPTYTPSYAPPPRPNIRVAFIAGEAVQAVAVQADPATRDLTLDEIALGEQAGQLIAEAKRVLSPDLYRAFLCWAEAASHFSTKWADDKQGDEEGNARCHRTSAALDAFTNVPVINPHDLAIKSYVLMLEVSDSSSAGPLRGGDEADSGYFDQELLHRVRRDYALVSPLPGLFDELAKRAWALSNSKLSWSVPVGGVITSAFSYARGAESVERDPLNVTIGDVWASARAEFDAASAAVNAGGLTDEQVDDLATKESDAAKVVMRLPSRTIADAATKLRIQMELNPLVEKNDLTGILADLDRLGRETVEIGPENPELVGAFTTFRDTFGELMVEPNDIDAAVEKAYWVRMDASDMILKTARATTPAGISMKLKRAFSGIIPAAWSDHALFDQRPAEFQVGLERSDLYEQMFWRAIEDLDRIAGVNLSEQGA